MIFSVVLVVYVCVEAAHTSVRPSGTHERGSFGLACAGAECLHIRLYILWGASACA